MSSSSCSTGSIWWTCSTRWPICGPTMSPWISARAVRSATTRASPTTRSARWASRRTLKDDDTDLRVTVTVPGREVLAACRQTLVEFLPVAVLLVGVLGFSIWRLRLRRISPVEGAALVPCATTSSTSATSPSTTWRWAGAWGRKCLMRWCRASGEEVRPDIFIADAEQHGFIIPLTPHLFQLIARDVAGLAASRGFPSRRQYRGRAHLQPRAGRARVRCAAASPTSELVLVLEITEHGLAADDDQVRRNIAALRDEGCWW